MDVRQCRNCRKLFQYRSSPLCPECVEALDRLFQDVRNYIYDNPRATIEQICEETGADSKLISGWLREGRLILSTENAALLKCESCGTAIRSGRFCEECAGQVKSRLEAAAREIAPPKPVEKKSAGRGSPKMHVDFRKKM